MPDIVSVNAQKLRKILDKAIEEQQITRDEYDRFLTIATTDGFFNKQERVLLSVLNDLILDRSVRIVPSKINK